MYSLDMNQVYFSFHRVLSVEVLQKILVLRSRNRTLNMTDCYCINLLYYNIYYINYELLSMKLGLTE